MSLRGQSINPTSGAWIGTSRDMNEYLGITCRYPIYCNANATNITLYGCHNGHLSEIALCGPCTQTWKAVNDDARIFCMCGLRIGSTFGTDYIIINLTDTTKTYRLNYVHGTAPDIRHPWAP